MAKIVIFTINSPLSERLIIRSQLMTNLSGRVGSWFAPKVTGIEVHFKDSSSTDKLWINEFTATDNKHYELAIESITPLFAQSSN